MSQANMVKVQWREVVRFLDEKPEDSVGHATSVVGVIGEDLGAAAFKHCVETNGFGHVRIHGGPVKGVGKRGPWLDRWIEVDSERWGNLLFQAEVKSSSAHAIGGKTLSLVSHGEELDAWKRDAWLGEFDEAGWRLRSPLTGKVLVRMVPHGDFSQNTQLPLLIFWRAVAPEFGRRTVSLAPGGHLFVVKSPNYGVGGRGPRESRVPPSWPQSQTNFDELWVFSVSSYLRSMSGKETVELDMPNVAFRMRALGDMVGS